MHVYIHLYRIWKDDISIIKHIIKQCLFFIQPLGHLYISLSGPVRPVRFLDLPGGNHLLMKLTTSLRPIRAVHKLRKMWSSQFFISLELEMLHLPFAFFVFCVLLVPIFSDPWFLSCAGERHRRRSGQSALRPKTKTCFRW